MKFSLSSTTVIIATLFVVDLTSASNGSDNVNDEKYQGVSSLNSTDFNNGTFITNETENGSQEIGECSLEIHACVFSYLCLQVIYIVLCSAQSEIYRLENIECSMLKHQMNTFDELERKLKSI